MGAGLSILLFSLVIYIPILVASIFFYLNSKEASLKEGKLSPQPPNVKKLIIGIYVVSIMFAGDAKLADLIWKIVNLEPYWIKYKLKDVLLGWDSWGDILSYWLTLLIAYFFMAIFLMKKISNINVRAYNKFILSIFNISIHPFIILSTMGWVFRWDAKVNEWLGL